MTNTPLQICVDTNVLLFLTIIDKCQTYAQLIQTNLSEEEFNKLTWLNNLIKAKKIELIITPTINEEIRFDSKSIKSNQSQHLSQQEVFKLYKKNNIKQQIQEYIQKNDNIKFTYFEDSYFLAFKNLTTELANAYSCKYTDEDENTSKKSLIHSKPFIRKKSGHLSHDSLAMAESTILGLDFLTFDQDFIKKQPHYNVPEAISSINYDILKSSVQPLDFNEFVEFSQGNQSKQLKINSNYKNKQASPVLPYKLFSYKDYVDIIENQNNGNKKNNSNINANSSHSSKNIEYLYVDSRTLFLLASEYLCRLREPKVYKLNRKIFEPYRIINQAVENNSINLVTSNVSMDLYLSFKKKLYKIIRNLQDTQENLQSLFEENSQEFTQTLNLYKNIQFETYMYDKAIKPFLKTHKIFILKTQLLNENDNEKINELASLYRLEPIHSNQTEKTETYNFDESIAQNQDTDQQYLFSFSSKQNEFFALEIAIAKYFGIDFVSTNMLEIISNLSTEQRIQFIQDITYKKFFNSSQQQCYETNSNIDDNPTTDLKETTLNCYPNQIYSVDDVVSKLKNNEHFNHIDERLLKTISIFYRKYHEKLKFYRTNKLTEKKDAQFLSKI